MSDKPIIMQTHPANLRTRLIGASLHKVGPIYSEFDYVCLMANIGNLGLITNFHWSWSQLRIQLVWNIATHRPRFIHWLIDWHRPSSKEF